MTPEVIAYLAIIREVAQRVIDNHGREKWVNERLAELGIEPLAVDERTLVFTLNSPVVQANYHASVGRDVVQDFYKDMKHRVNDDRLQVCVHFPADQLVSVEELPPPLLAVTDFATVEDVKAACRRILIDGCSGRKARNCIPGTQQWWKELDLGDGMPESKRYVQRLNLAGTAEFSVYAIDEADAAEQLEAQRTERLNSDRHLHRILYTAISDMGEPTPIAQEDSAEDDEDGPVLAAHDG